MNTIKKDIRALSKEESKRVLYFYMGIKLLEEPKFMSGSGKKGAHHFDDMTNLSKDTRLDDGCQF